jgi:hypothetical protein
VVPGQGLQAQPYLGIERPDITAELRFELRDDSQQTPSGDRQETRKRWRGRLEFATEGWVYHPGLLAFELHMEPEYEIENVDLSGQNDSQNQRTFWNYVLGATFLQYKPYSLEILSALSRRELDNAFSPDTVIDTYRGRADVVLDYTPWSGRIGVENRRTEVSGFRESRQSLDTFRIQGRHTVERSRSALVAEFANDDRENEGRRDEIDRYRGIFGNQFDLRENMLLTSDIYWYRDDAKLGVARDSRQFRIVERLLVRHRPKLRSHYRLEYDDRKISEQESQNVSGEAGLSHQLYENLSSTATLRGNYLTTNDGDITFLEGEFDTAYTRPIPWGSVNAFFGLDLRYEDNARQADRVENEPVTLRGTVEEELVQLNIVLETVVVSGDPQGIELFEEGIDYVLTQGTSVGGAVTTFIRRTGPTSRIEDGETVFVSYTFEPTPPFTLFGHEIRGGVGVNLWNTLNLSYSIARNQEDLVAGTAPPDLADDTIQRATATLNWRFSLTEFSWEDRDTTRSPTTTWRVRERLRFRFGRRIAVGAQAAYQERDNKDLDDLVKTLRYGGNGRWQITPRAYFEVEGFQENVESSRQDNDRTGIRAGLHWRYGLWFARARYWFDRYEDHVIEQVRKTQRFMVEVGREFW